MVARFESDADRRLRLREALRAIPERPVIVQMSPALLVATINHLHLGLSHASGTHREINSTVRLIVDNMIAAVTAVAPDPASLRELFDVVYGAEEPGFKGAVGTCLACGAKVVATACTRAAALEASREHTLVCPGQPFAGALNCLTFVAEKLNEYQQTVGVDAKLQSLVDELLAEAEKLRTFTARRGTTDGT